MSGHPAPSSDLHGPVAAPPVDLPVFSGPLDLLLHLIRKNELSIYDIPIATVCDQYHDHLARMADLDLGVAGDFLWMAAWLLHIKSRSLLPSPSVHDAEDPRRELVERLLEYRRVKEVAEMLYERDVVRRCLWTPAVRPDLGAPETELDWEDVDLSVLARTYLEVMQRFEAAHPPPLTVLPLRYTVGRTMRHLYRRVRSEGVVPLLRVMHTTADAERVVVLVVATLELVRLGGVVADQRVPFAEIYLRPGGVELAASQLGEGEDGNGE